MWSAPGRSGAVERQWVGSQPIWWADQIQVAAIDAFRGYATAIGGVVLSHRGGELFEIDELGALMLSGDLWSLFLIEISPEDLVGRVDIQVLHARRGSHIGIGPPATDTSALIARPCSRLT